ncbi:hypothetical protein [Streptomyces sp. HUAS TT20]|uniref:hypothetical protein n=1 Tax=Streptomyces sp. HUAS TT20 TaxID=3447509 RepID=UPI0021DABEB8|nr:hypothetical protein [Streptomyces sp. HUAS 15-9]UXY33024.1 hypothetical protein N8I87_42715 [Streptomyces sp. HUAS 15-9]
MRHSRTAAGIAVAAPATGVVAAGAETTADRIAVRRITTREQLAHSLRRAVALERAGSDAPLFPRGRGVGIDPNEPAC